MQKHNKKFQPSLLRSVPRRKETDASPCAAPAGARPAKLRHRAGAWVLLGALATHAAWADDDLTDAAATGADDAGSGKNSGAVVSKPLWEAGLGIAAVSFPDYRGSNHRQGYVLPTPYFVYRGDFLKINGRGVRGLLLKEDNAEVDVSLSGSVPVKSKDDSARTGMPNLPATLEIGPSLHVKLAKSEDGDERLDLRLPVRPVFSVFGGVHYEGLLFQPQINLDVRNIKWLPGWNLGFLTGPIFSSARYNQLFYSVNPAYATAFRPVFEARVCYAGAQFIASASKRYPSFWVGAFVKADTVSGAVFGDSPLIKAKANYSAGFSINWILDASSTQVKAHE